MTPTPPRSSPHDPPTRQQSTPHTKGATTMTAKLPNECGTCQARWGGYNTAHCSGCHLTFTGLSAFDKHRDGSHAKSTRHCVSPESVGLIEAGRAYPCWGFPGDPERQFAAAVGARITVEEQP